MNPLEFIYYLGYRMDTWAALRAQKRLPVPVISIGNLTTGGTGKTPATIALASHFKSRGITPCILTRGYRGSLKGPCRVEPDMDASQVGDEPLLMARALPQVAVIKCASRYDAGMFALANVSPAPELFILDDGFQHRRLHADLDIVLIDAHEPFGNGKLLPMGRLREPASELKRAGVVLITRGDDPAMLERARAAVREHNPVVPIFSSTHRLTGLIDQHGQRFGLEAAQGKVVYAFCGIARPQGFAHSLKAHGIEPARLRAFPDHHAFSNAELEGMDAEARNLGAAWIITTQKDIMRLGKRSMALPLLAASMELVPEPQFYDAIDIYHHSRST